MSNDSLNRNIPRTNEMDGEIYSVNPNVNNGRFFAAEENNPIGIADEIPANISKRNFPLPPVAKAPIPFPSR